MRINTNISAMNTYSRLTSANNAKSSSLAKLSSGLRINKAGDDAAGLAISEKMKNQISGLTQASRNAQDGISLIQTAEGALSETHSILNRMRDLTVQAANGTNTEDDRSAIQSEMDSLTAEIDRIADTTTFNTQGLMNGLEKDSVKLAATLSTVTGDAKSLAVLETEYNKLFETMPADNANASATEATSAINKLDAGQLDKLIQAYNNEAERLNSNTNTDGTPDASDDIETFDTESISQVKEEFTFQIGANAGEKIEIGIENMSSRGLDISNLDVSSSNADFDNVLSDIDDAIKEVSDQRANLGAVQNRLDHTVSNLATTKENLSEANSRIVDVDMAEEMMSFTKNNILSQAATSMLAQANQMPQGVLSLLQ